MKKDRPLKVAFYDEALAMGGSLMVLSHLFKALDRSKVVPMLVSAMPCSELAGLFVSSDIIWARRPLLNYATHIRWQRWGGQNAALRRLAVYAHTFAYAGVNLIHQIKLVWLLRRHRPDIIHINNGHLAFVLGWLLRIPIVFHLHGVQVKPSVFRRWLVVRAKAFIAISDLVKDSALGAGYPAERIHLIPNPAPVVCITESREQIRGRYNIPQDSVVFAHVGRLVRWKGQLEFLKAFALLYADNRSVFAIIVGDSGEGFGGGYQQSLYDFVRENDLNDVVSFLGQAQDVLPLMSASDVVVHSSIEPEPFGLVITEAMAVGVAVVGSSFGAAKEIIESGKDGVVVNPLNTTELAQALCVLAGQRAYRESMGKAGKIKAELMFSAGNFARTMSDIYEQLHHNK